MTRLKGFIQWLCLFKIIFSGRSVKTYGKEHIKYIYAKFKYEYLTELKELELAENAIYTFSKSLNIENVGQMTRFGPSGDGGYIGVDLFETPTVLSGGAGKNIDFEVFFANRGSKVMVFDPTIQKLPKTHQNIRHKKIGLESTNSNKFRNSINLSKSLKMVNEAFSRQNGLYLKVDIEGSEWDLLAASLTETLNFDQIFIEFHDLYKLSDENFRKKYLRVNNFLVKNFYFISFTANNWATYINFGKGFTPLIYECTLLNKKHKSILAKKNKVSNKHLIYKNNANRPLIHNRPFFMD